MWKRRSYWALPWAEERSISISDFKTHEPFNGRVLPNELPGKGDKRGQSGKRVLVSGKNGQVRLPGWGGPPGQVQQRNFPGCRHGGPGWALMACEADTARRSGGPCRNSYSGPSCFWLVPSLRPPVLPCSPGSKQLS